MSKQRNALFINMSKVEFYQLVFHSVLLFSSALGNSCDSHNVHKPQCSDTQMCDESTSTCVCITGYSPFNETHCLQPETPPSPPSTVPAKPAAAEHGSSATVALIVIPLILVLFVIFGIYVSRKYKLASWFRRKIQQRNSTYDEFMIGQEDDDPPLR